MRQHIRSFHASTTLHLDQPKPLIDIRNATFYRHHPSTERASVSNPGLFPGLNFCLFDSLDRAAPQYWSIVSPSSLARTTFLQILDGQYVSIPPSARSYPYLSDILESPQHAIKYVGFDADRGSNVGGNNVRGAYLSARYESRREETDFSVLDYLSGNTELNALEHVQSPAEQAALTHVTEQLDLRNLLSMPVANLSNGQTRRVRIARAVMGRPEVLLLDGPFMGLDPNTAVKMSSVLQQLAANRQPRLVMSLRPEDGVPAWVSHLVVVDKDCRVLGQGPKRDVLDARLSDHNAASIQVPAATSGTDYDHASKVSKDGFQQTSPALVPREAVVEMLGVKVAYGDRTVLGDWEQAHDGEQRPGLWWSLHRGQRYGIFGPNGSGKTTMLSLITSDHPQTYSLPIKLFGRSRLPQPGEQGISLFDLQKRMGHSSPEVHAFFPKGLTARRALESAWADAPMAKPRLSPEHAARVDACLRWFAKELNPASRTPSLLDTLEDNRCASSTAELHLRFEELTKDDEDIAWARHLRFGELSFSSQRLLLFLRATIASPDLVILDEALSGVDESTRDKALLFLSHGETIWSIEHGQARPSTLSRMDKVVCEGLNPSQALLVISHSKEDVPGCIREWICLPEPGEGRPPRMGTLEGPLELNPQGWRQIWAQE